MEAGYYDRLLSLREEVEVKEDLAETVKREEDKNKLVYIIEKRPGLTSNELAKELSWSNEKVNNYLSELMRDHEIIIKTKTAYDGKVKNQIYAVNWREMMIDC